MANSGISLNVNSNSKYFVRPPKITQEGQEFVLILDRDSIGINNSSWRETKSMSVIEMMINGCLIRKMRNSESIWLIPLPEDSLL